MNIYTLAFIFTEDLSKVLLIEKKRPDWQAGLLNGIGGKVNENELPDDCIVREVKEEAGLEINDFLNIGKIEGDNYIVYVYTTKIPYIKMLDGKSLTDERVGIYSMYRLDTYKLLPSVKYLLPMALQPYLDDKFKSFTTYYG